MFHIFAGRTPRDTGSPPAAACVAALCLIAFSTAPVAAQITNGSFESGLNGWTVTPGSSVESLRATDFGTTPIVPPDGSFMCLLSNGPGNIAAPGGDFDSNSVNDFDGSTIGTSFTTNVADETFSFEWAFLTDEVGSGGQGQDLYDDLLEITIDGVKVVTGSVNKPGGSSPYPDTASYDDTRYTVSSAGPTDGSDFGTAPLGGRTEFQKFCIPIANPGSHTLEIRVADQGDSTFDSGLLIDAVQVSASCDARVQITVSEGSLLEVKGGALVFSQVENGPPSTTFDGATLAFRSNGDFNGDNPNLQEQIWIANRNGAIYDIVRLTGVSGAAMGNPDISRRGDWVVFSSTGDLVAGGNGDGNPEIFRYDAGAGTFLQITDTLACENSAPSVNESGSRIAFLSDCAGAGRELMFWDGSLRGAGTSGCDNRLPTISSDPDGRYVTFLTGCGSQYAGVTNPDGGDEVVQWETTTDLFAQITNTPAGFSTDVPSASDDGRFVGFLSTADLDLGQNPASALVAFRHDRSIGDTLQLTPADPLSLYTFASIDGSGAYVAVERLDLLTSAFEIGLVDSGQPGVVIPISSDGPTVTQASPAVAAGAGEVLVHYLSNGDSSGNNADLNTEIWRGSSSLSPPIVKTYCRTPALAIPDRSTVNDVLTITDSGTLTDLDLFVNITHEHVGDLRITLRHVDTGSQQRLVDRPGRPPGFGCSGDDIEATLDDEAASPVQNECVTPGPIAIFGSFTPRRPLGIFDGEDLAGDWRLTVSDRKNRGIGELVEWCLIASTP